jgi:hypothetical protein
MIRLRVLGCSMRSSGEPGPRTATRGYAVVQLSVHTVSNCAAYTYSLPRYMPPTKDAGDAPRFDIKQPVQPELRNIQPTRPASYNPKTDVWLDDWIM